MHLQGSPEREKERGMDRTKRAKRSSSASSFYSRDDAFPNVSSLPRMMDSGDLLTARLSEIHALASEISDAGRKSGGGQRAFQTLPRHLRRRAMSHNPYRVPIQLRRKALQENDETAKKENASRKKNRRMKFAKEVFSQRSDENRNGRWLVTHLWHRKRMQMKSLWGTKIAWTPNDKNFKFVSKSVSRFSVVHDRSYYSIVELSAKTKEEICSFMDPFIDPTVGFLKEDDRFSFRGFFYQHSKFQSQLICPFDYIWIRKQQNTSLWMWIHPSVLQVVLNLLEEQLEKQASGVKLSNLGNEFCTLDILGPRCSDILKSTFDAYSDDTKTSVAQPTVESLKDVWQHFRCFTSPAGFPKNAIFQLRVPKQSPLKSSKQLYSSPSNQEVQDVVLRNLYLWSDWPVPSLHDASFDKSSFFLVYLIQLSSASSRDTFGSGWSIIVPRDNCLLLWNRFIFSGARAIGLSDYRRIRADAGMDTFPQDFVETFAGKCYDEWCKSQSEKIHYSRPPAKRVNYEKLGIQNPFSISWHALFKDKASSGNMMELCVKERAHEEIDLTKLIHCSSEDSAKFTAPFFTLRDRMSESELSSHQLSNALVPVLVISKSKGTIHDRAIILSQADSSSSNVIGHVNFAFMSLHRGYPCGIGFCKYNSLIELGLYDPTLYRNTAKIAWIQNLGCPVVRKIELIVRLSEQF